MSWRFGASYVEGASGGNKSVQSSVQFVSLFTISEPMVEISSTVAFTSGIRVQTIEETITSVVEFVSTWTLTEVSVSFSSTAQFASTLEAEPAIPTSVEFTSSFQAQWSYGTVATTVAFNVSMRRPGGILASGRYPK